MEKHGHFSGAVSQFYRTSQEKQENNFEDVLILSPINFN